MTLVGLFFWYVPSWGGTFYLLWTDIEVHPIIIYLIILSIFNSMAIVVIVFAIKTLLQDLQRFNLNLSDLQLYHQIHILTNERWIQKDFRSFGYFGENKLPTEAISQIKDIVFINLKNIEKATVTKIRSNYKITFHFKRILSINQYPTFNIKFKYDDYQELKDLLIDIIPIEILKD